MSQEKDLSRLRKTIQESLRVQRGSADAVNYIDTGSVLSDVMTKQNHVVFARRGCGKSLLLHQSARRLGDDVQAVYLNCEDFKRHSFPNVLIEILDSLFGELEKHLTGWFGKRKKSRELVQGIRRELAALRSKEDLLESDVRTTKSAESKESLDAQIGGGTLGATTKIGATSTEGRREEVERRYRLRSDKLRELDNWLPRLKSQIREFFEVSTSVKVVLLQIDDLYHLKREDQPFVVDYVHRLCKDVPLFFKMATLRHASVLYVDRDGQPIGAQERHDYQPINIDYTFSDFTKTRKQNKLIFHEFGRLSGMSDSEIDGLFKGQGFDRLVLAGGGVPRDVLSLFLEVLEDVQANGDGRIGKDDVRNLSRANFERRIEELKHDAQAGDQETLIKGIYVLREFCLKRQTNVFMISERDLQQRDDFRSLIYRLLDYRIIHNAATALTHKSHEGTFQAFAIDIGCYAHLRKLQGKFNEIDLSSLDDRDRLRSVPVLDFEEFQANWVGAPADVESRLRTED